jgi:two-component sensor histidine kinase
LATNAAKYGALSSSVGRVRLSWQVGPRHLELQWAETGGPSVQPPHSEGYGTRVITASVERQLDGCATFDWHPEGLRFTMSIPLGKDETAGKRFGDAGRPKKTKALRYEKSWREIGFCWSRTRRSPV